MKVRTINKDDKKHFQQFYTEHNVIGWMEDGVCKRIIVKMKTGRRAWTPRGTARDCGDHYIIAHYSSYDRVEKETMQITRDVDDK